MNYDDFIMNKAIIVGISIAILIALGGIFFMSSDTQIMDDPNQISELDDYEPKHYSESLTESVTVSIP